MATTAAGTGSQVIGKVFIIYGKVQAVAPDGTVRVLGPNSPVYANERIVTEGDGSVSLMLDGPPPVQIDLGRMSDVLLNEDVYGAATPAVVADASAEAEKIQQALAEGDQPIELEATAAGGAGDSGGAHPIVNFGLDGNEITPGSGAGTTGVTFGAVDTTPGVVDETPAPPAEPELPTLSISDAIPVTEPAYFYITEVNFEEGGGDDSGGDNSDYGREPVYAEFTVTLSKASTEVVTVNFTTADGTAVHYYIQNEFGDFIELSGSVTFAPGETSQTILVQILSDYIYEGSENFYVNLSDPTNATILDGQGIGTIVDVNLLTDGGESVTTLEDTTLAMGAVNGVLADTFNPDGPNATTVTQFVVEGDSTVYAAGQTATIAGVGTLVINSDGSYTFTPAANYAGDVPVASYTVTDGADTYVSTLTIDVAAVADAPLLMMSVDAPTVTVTVTVIEGEALPPVTIPVSPTAQGIYAYSNVNDIDFENLANTGATVSDAGAGNGIGVLTTNEGHGLGADSIKPGEALVIDLDGTFKSAVVTFKHAQSDDILWGAYDQYGNYVDSGSIPHGTGNEGWIVESITLEDEFSYLVISGGTGEGTSQLGFTVFSIVATPDSVDNYEYTYTYPLTVQAALTDLDGSEDLGPVNILVDSLPEGTSLVANGEVMTATGDYYEVFLDESGSATLSLVSSTALTSAEINDISGSVTSTETGEGGVTIAVETATTDASALIELNGTDGDDILNGTDANELIRGGAGDDTLVGGGGDDVIVGGTGADTFHTGDVGKVADFNATEGDELANLIPPEPV